MNRTLITILACSIIGGCSEKPVVSLALPSRYPGTQIEVFLSQPVVHRGETTTIVFEMKNVTNCNIKVIKDILCHYFVQPDMDLKNGTQVGYAFGEIPKDAYINLMPGETFSQSYRVFTDPAQLTEGFSKAAKARGARRAGLLFGSPGVHKIGISPGCQRPQLGTIELTILDK